MREGLRGLLEDEAGIEVVGEADSGLTAIELARTLDPDVVVMDITMPDLNGISATKEILRRSDHVRVIALSMQTSQRFVTDMLRAGAAGYVTKNAPLEEFVSAIRAVAAGKTYLSPDIAEHVVENHLDRGATPRRSSAGGKSISDREREVLQLVAEGKSTREIASLLYISGKTVGWHRQSIAAKLGIRNVAELTKYAIREGLTDLAS